ncbi:MAG: hypothetical protein DI623_02590 [Sphingomonas sanxanigenens]|uniref:Uncharacterized protein n=1 Tax=Sphingomonas sanxanigenens TaxID=397260 RepID=A0A2W5ABS0_9SPHN|nr:MAG: hypothetical protein DI623_02590 [Sphingomonas sanxanigenens]
MLPCPPAYSAPLFDIARIPKLRIPLQPLNFVNFRKAKPRFSAIPYMNHRHAALLSARTEKSRSSHWIGVAYTAMLVA